jgi:hypothetical protein
MAGCQHPYGLAQSSCHPGSCAKASADTAPVFGAGDGGPFGRPLWKSDRAANRYEAPRDESPPPAPTSAEIITQIQLHSPGADSAVRVRYAQPGSLVSAAQNLRLRFCACDARCRADGRIDHREGDYHDRTKQDCSSLIHGRAPEGKRKAPESDPQGLCVSLRTANRS